MRQSPMLEYSLSEFEGRMAKAAEKVKAAGLKCIMGTSKAMVCYLTGLRSVAWKSKLSTPGLIFLGADGNYGVVGSFSAVDTAMYTTCLDKEDFYFFDASGRYGVALNYYDALCYTLRHLGFTEGKIGCELSGGFHLHMDIAMFNDLKRDFPDLEFVDTTELFWDILAVKSEAQLKNMRDAEEVNRKAVAKGLEVIKPGSMTEMELYKEIAKAGDLAGSEHFTYMSVLAGAERALCADCPASEAVVIPDAPGTTVRVEGGAIRRELNAPFTANIVVGGVQPEQQPAWDLATGMIESAMAAVKPGACAGDVADAMDAFASAQGKAEWVVQPGYAGSGIGWGRIDGPLLRKNSKFALNTGMVLTLVASVRHDSVGVLTLRQNVVVTDSGCSFLNGKTSDPLTV